MLNIKNIKSFVINLPQFPLKYERTMKNLSMIDIYPQKEDAVYGKNLSKEQVTEIVYPSVDYTIKHGRYTDSDIFSFGAIGCYLSHTNLWKKLASSPEYKNDDMFLIFEDDVAPPAYTLEKINTWVNSVNQKQTDWDMLFLGWMKPLPVKDADIKLEKSIYKINDITFGLHAYIIRKKGAQALLKKAFPIVDQIDSYISYMAARGDINAYRSNVSFFYQANMEGSQIQESIVVNIKPHLNRFPPKLISLFIVFTLILTILCIFLFAKNFKK
jgi:GR25 family glycosyltransferase involved in LPS biosynthesis